MEKELADLLVDILVYLDCCADEQSEDEPDDSVDLAEQLGKYLNEHGINRFRPIPDDFPVKAISEYETAKVRATCGTCGRTWDDGVITSMTPAPSGRCPFEAFHEYE